MMETNIEKFINLLREYKIYHSPASLIWYYEKYIFRGINLNNKNILDVGGGTGMISFYAALKNAARIDFLEPLAEGSVNISLNKYHLMKTLLPEISNKIAYHNIIFQEFNPGIKYDIVILHNSINHLNEDACINIHNRVESYNEYVSYFRKMFGIMNPGGYLIFTDCSNKNFYRWIGITNPFAPEIEWDKHQDPRTWLSLLNATGFENARTEWTSFKQLRTAGSLLLANKIASFFITSHFAIRANKH